MAFDLPMTNFAQVMFRRYSEVLTSIEGLRKAVYIYIYIYIYIYVY